MGIDLSLTSTGLAGFKDGQLWVHRIQTTGKKGDSLASRATRLDSILYDVTAECLSDGDLDLAVIESPSFGSQHGAAHDRSGLWWLVVSMLHEVGVPVAMCSPQGRAKYATGKGNSDKQQVYYAACETYKHHPAMAEVTGIDWRRGNDMADAVILAAMGSRYLGEKREVALMDTNLAAMDGVAWPEGVMAA
jgi:crossover junction endodeoxyribonuclease RuvC